MNERNLNKDKMKISEDFSNARTIINKSSWVFPSYQQIQILTSYLCYWQAWTFDTHQLAQNDVRPTFYMSNQQLCIPTESPCYKTVMANFSENQLVMMIPQNDHHDYVTSHDAKITSHDGWKWMKSIYCFYYNICMCLK